MRRLILALLLPVAIAAGASQRALSQPASGPLLLPPITRALDQQLGTIRTENANDPDQAIARLTALLLQAERGRQAGEQIVILTARSQQEIRAKRIDRAIEDLNRAIAISGAYPLPFFLRGSYESLRGDRPKALADLDKAIELEPQYVAAYWARAEFYEADREWAKAAADYGRILGVRGEDNKARLYRASALSDSGSHKQALDELEVLLSKAPANVDLTRAKATFQRYFGNVDGAMRTIESVINVRDKKGLLNFERGLIHLTRGDYAAAERDMQLAFDTGLANGSPHPYAAVYLELARLRLGRSNIQDLDRRQALAFTKAPSGLIADYLAGRLTAEALLAKASEGAQNARIVDERTCEAQYFIGQRLLAQGAASEAVQAFKAATAPKVFWLNSHYLAGWELVRLGRP